MQECKTIKIVKVKFKTWLLMPFKGFKMPVDIVITILDKKETKEFAENVPRLIKEIKEIKEEMKK